MVEVFEMNAIVSETMCIMEKLPVDEQNILLKMAKKMIREWDQDYTKLTSTEEESLKETIREMESGIYVTDKDIEWE